MSLTNDQITAKNFKDFYEYLKPYLGLKPVAGYTPVGTVISVMGTHAPENYLKCDGAVYNIVDYPELSDYFEEQFGQVDFFGGDGVDTFAVPDLQGEFLRGTGTNSHTDQGSGANVGVHQDATEHVDLYTTHNALITPNQVVPNSKTDSVIGKVSTYRNLSASTGTSTVNTSFTSRPTNTSVLYCIAYKNIYITQHVIDDRNVYSETEKIVGEWIDGKPIYQKTFVDTITTYTDASTRRLFSYTLLSTTDAALIDEVVNVDMLGRAVKSGDTRVFTGTSSDEPLDGVVKSMYFQWKIDSSEFTVQAFTRKTDAVTSVKFVITVQYTKTTD